jgi:hypothetical protein
VTNSSVLSPVQPSIESDSSTYTSSQNASENLIPANLLILEHLDLKDSWCGLFACFSIAILTIHIFWGFLFFDMVADEYGTSPGIASSCCVCLVPFLIILCLDDQLIPYSKKIYAYYTTSIRDYLVCRLNLDLLDSMVFQGIEQSNLELDLTKTYSHSEE